ANMAHRKKGTTASGARSGRTPRRSARLVAVWLTLSDGVIDTEPVGETQDDARGLAERVYDVIGTAGFPQKRLKGCLERATETPVLAVKPGRRGFNNSDIAGVLRELVERGGRIPPPGLVKGTAALVKGPAPDEESAAWLQKLLKSST